MKECYEKALKEITSLRDMQRSERAASRENRQEALESKNSCVFDQAENRLHIQQALLAAQLGGL